MVGFNSYYIIFNSIPIYRGVEGPRFNFVLCNLGVIAK